MPITTTQIDNTSIVLDGASYRDHIFTRAANTAYPAGLLLALNTSTQKIVPYVASGANDTDTPVSVLTYDIPADATGGDVGLRFLQKGVVRADYLRVLATVSTVGVTNQVLLGSLQGNGIASVFSDERSEADNE